MKSIPECRSNRLRHALLAPKTQPVSSVTFRQPTVHPFCYEALLTLLQRLRGRVYAADGAISVSQLDDEGRHCSENDRGCWHLVLLDDYNAVNACIRIFVAPLLATFANLQIRHSALTQSREWCQQVRSALARDVRGAQVSGFSYVELGGWALSSTVRGDQGSLDVRRGHLCLGAARWGLHRSMRRNDTTQLRFDTLSHRGSSPGIRRSSVARLLRPSLWLRDGDTSI
jgi:hypothetical protein